MVDGREPQSEPWVAGTLVAARYEVLEHLGTGGMGVVYRAKDTQSQRSVALKTIRRDLDSEQRLLVSKLLRAEAEALSRVDSDFVVRIFEAHTGDDATDLPFVVMELLRGRDLQRVLKEDGPMPPALALPLLWQAACGLKAIHAQDIVHRDLKPGNLYVKTRDDSSLELKILDFSISRLLDRASGRKTTIIVGTRGFMAPEQAAGYDVDHRADVFALGQVAHEMLLGARNEAPAPSDQFPLQAFSSWHAKATASDRRERFDTAPEAIIALAVVLGLPLAPSKPPEPPTAGLFETATTVLAAAPRRRPTVLLLGLGGVALVVWLALRHEAPPVARAVVVSGAPLRGDVATPLDVSVPEPSAPVRVEPTPAATTSSALPTTSATSRRMRRVTARTGAAASVAPPVSRPSDQF